MIDDHVAKLALRQRAELPVYAATEYRRRRLAELDRAAIRKNFETRFTARRMALDYLSTYQEMIEAVTPRIKLVSSAE